MFYNKLMKKLTLLLISLLLLTACNEEKKPLSIKEQYPEITGESMFIDASQEQVLNMLENGTGIVFFSWIDCPWCHGYIDLVNNAAIENDINVLYYDIYNDRQENNEFYKKVISIVKDDIGNFPYQTNGEIKKAYDSDGNPRIYVPMTICVAQGKIYSIDYSSSMESDYEKNFESYWNEEIKAGYTKRNQLSEYFDNCFSVIKQLKEKIDKEGCTEACEL